MSHARLRASEHERIREALDAGNVWIYGLVEKHSGERIVEAQQIVGALAIPDRERPGARRESPGAGTLVRRYYLGRNDRLLSVSLNVYPADRFEFSTRWRLADPAEASTDDAKG